MSATINLDIVPVTKLLDAGIAPAGLVIVNNRPHRILTVGAMQVLVPWNPMDDYTYLYDLLTLLPFSLQSRGGTWQITLGNWTEIVSDLAELPRKIYTMALAYCGEKS